MTIIIGNKRNQNIPNKTSKLQKPKLSFGFVPAHFKLPAFGFIKQLKIVNFLINQEVLS